MSEKPKTNKALKNYAYYSNMAIEMGVLICVGVFGGKALDQWLHTSPLFIIVCSLMGIFISLYVMIKTLVRSEKSLKDE